MQQVILEEQGEKTQKYNITAFYPLDDDKPCYLPKPKLRNNQVLSVSNSKFNKSTNGELDLILTSTSVLEMAPAQLPVHQITVVEIAMATEMAEITEFGVKVDCLISDYLSKDKQIELPVTLFHPTGSRFSNQTTTIKRGSSIFFWGGLTLIEEELYLELHNFVRTTTTTKPMPWASKSSSDNSIPTSPNIAQSFHKLSKKSSTSVNSILTTSDKTSANITKSPHKWNKKSSNSANPILASPTLATIETSDSVFFCL